MADFTAPKVKRGRLTNFRTGNYVTFLYNPTSLSETKGNNLSEDAIPGFSDPLIRFASGKARVVTFSLEIDGESRIRRSGVNLLNGARPEPIENALGFSIAGEIEFFQSLEYPVDPSLPGSDGGPDKVVFTLGPMYDGVLCVVEQVPVTITEWDPELNPTRATLNLTLKAINIPQQYAHHVWKPPIGGLTV